MSDQARANLSSESPALQQPRSTIGAALPFFLCVAVLFTMAYGGWVWWRVQKFDVARSQAIAATPIGPPLSEFELTERSGKPFRSADMKGKVWVATYFFTTCPGNCIRLNQNIQLMNNRPELQDVTWVSISCDPDTDNLQALRKYADRMQADPDRWLFCRAPLEYTQRVAAGMKIGLPMRKMHQDYAVVVDKSGNIRGMFDAVSRSDCEKMHSMLLELQQEEPPQNIVTASADDQKSS